MKSAANFPNCDRIYGGALTLTTQRVVPDTAAPVELFARVGESGSSVFVGDAATARTSVATSRADLMLGSGLTCGSVSGAATSAAAPPVSVIADKAGFAARFVFPCSTGTRPAAQVPATRFKDVKAAFGNPSALAVAQSVGELHPSTSSSTKEFEFYTDITNDPIRELLVTDTSGQYVPQVCLRGTTNVSPGVSSLAQQAPFPGADYVEVPLSSQETADPLAGIDTSAVVVRRDSQSGAIVTFDAYIASWSSLVGHEVAVAPDCAKVSGRLDGVVRIATRGTHNLDDSNPSNPYADSGIQLGAGILACSAVEAT